MTNRQLNDEVRGDARKTRIEELLAKKDSERKEEAAAAILKFDKTPKDIKKYFDEYIIGQEDAKKIVATAVSFHYKRLSNLINKELANNGGDFESALKNVTTPKANILLIGPSGCGKTYTSEKCHQLVNVPFVKEDITKFSETGYVGRDLSEIYTDILAEAKGNEYLAQLGIVYLDEIDKISGAPGAVGRDVSGVGVQNGLLKLVEGAENTIDYGMSKIKFSTKHMLFIASGAFEELEKIVLKRLERRGVRRSWSWKEYLLTSDLVEYKMTRQFIGRFPVRVFYNQLNKENLIEIMKTSKDSPLSGYSNDFSNWGINLKFTDEAIATIAEAAELDGTGARGLTGILNKVLVEHMYALPGEQKGDVLVDERYAKERLHIE